jgi:beta-barrel assembly-enhancing protease
MFKKLFVLVLGFGLCFLAGGCATNPVTGETQFNLFGEAPADDAALGKQWAPELEKEFGGVFDNNQVQNYISYTGQNVGQISHAPYLQWHYKVLQDKTVNAFALPGGYVYITTAMLRKLTTEAQLAGVLAHETAHVTLRHSTVRMSQQIGFDILLTVAMPKNVSPGVMQATSVARQIIALKYSRDDEAQADMIGLRYMVQAGYNPYGMVQTMEMLEKESGSSTAEFMSSHPSPEHRISNLMQEIEVHGYYSTGLKTREEDYRKMVLEPLSKVSDIRKKK